MILKSASEKVKEYGFPVIMEYNNPSFHGTQKGVCICIKDNESGKIIENHIIELVIESNVTSELKQNLDMILSNNGVSYCQIREKYNVENKQIRIQDQKGNIVRRLVFPNKGSYGPNSDMGRFMENLTLYNDNGRNPTDDAPDSAALTTQQFIEGDSKPNKVKPMKRLW